MVSVLISVPLALEPAVDANPLPRGVGQAERVTSLCIVGALNGECSSAGPHNGEEKGGEKEGMRGGD